MKRWLDSWQINEDEPGWADLIAAFAVFVLFLIVVLVYTTLAWSAT